MANVIRLKRASGSDPAASDLVSGEPAVRTDTGELFFKKDDGSVAKVSGAGGGPDFKYLALRNAANNGAASFPNADFTLVTSGTTSAITPTAANTLLVSVNGVIQKPNTGTSTPSSGFALSGSTIKFGGNISAAPEFILYQESGGIGEPSDETVSEEKLKVSNSPVNGYFLSAQSGNNGGLTWAAPVATSCTGNSATATALATARTINGTSFDGTANITVTAAAGTLTGNTLNSSVTASSLTSLGDLSGLTVTGNLAEVNKGSVGTYLKVGGDNASNGRALTFTSSTGNTGSNGALHTINATSSNGAIALATGSSEALRINSSGLVGIGTTSPQRLLHQHVDNSFANYHSFTNSTTGSSSSDGLLLGINSTEDGVIWNHESTNLRFATANTERMRIDSSGNVGIGTTSPETLLHAKVNTFNDDINKVALTLSNNQSSGVHQYFQNTSTGTGVSNGARIGLGNTDNFLIQHFEAKDIQISTNSTERMRIASDGKVGIGLTSPARLLHQHLASSSSNYHQFTNSTTGSSSTDGFLIGLTSLEEGLIWNYENTPLRIGTNNTERMRIDNNGKVLIATTTTSEASLNNDELIIGSSSDDANHGLTIVTPSSRYGTVAFSDGSSGTGRGLLEYNHSSDFFRIYVAGSERMRIDSSGVLRVGSTASYNSSDKMTLVGTGNTSLTIDATSSTSSSIFFADGADGTEAYRGYLQYNHASDALFIGTSASEAMRIDSSGRVLIGTTTEGNSSADDLTIASSTSCGISIRSGTSNSGNIYFSDGTSGDSEYRGFLSYSHTNNDLSIGVNTATRMLIDSSGRVIVGSTSHIGGAQFVVMGGNINTYGAMAIGNKAANPTSGTAFANFRFNSGATGTRRGAEIAVHTDGNWTDGSSHPSRMTFSTTAASATGSTERIRIDSSGKVGINESSNINGRLHVQHDALAENILYATRYNSQSTDKPIFAVTEAQMTNFADSGTIIGNHNRDIFIGPVFQDTGVVDTSDTTGICVRSSGRVGIGTTNPSSNLHSYHATDNEAARFESGDEYVHVVFKDSTTTNEPYIGARGNNLRAITGGAERMRIDNNGHVLFTAGSSQRVAFGTADNTKYAGFGRADGAAQDVGLNFFTTTNAGSTFVNHFRIEHNGELYGTDQGIGNISDSRVKKNISDYSYDIEKFKKYKSKTFDWVNPEMHGDKTNVKGFLAQDIEEVDSQWVTTINIDKDDPDYDLVDKGKNGQGEDVGIIKTSKFGSKDAMYISVINQLIARVEVLEAK